MGPPVPGNIPWWQIKLWAEDHDMTRSQFRMLDICIRRMDETYRQWFAERQVKESEIQQQKSQPRVG